MKVIQINSLYNSGSTGKIVHDCHKYYLNNDIDSIVCYGRGKSVKEDRVYRVCSEYYSKLNNLWSRITGLMYGGLSISTNRLIKIIKEEKPDVVHLQCVNGYFVNIYKLITFLKDSHIKTVLTLHAEFMFTANCGHSFDCEKWKTGCGNCPRFKSDTKSLFIDNTAKSWLRLKKAFEGFDGNLVVSSVSPWLQNRAKVSPILGGFKHVTVLNGLDTSVFNYKGLSLREFYNIDNRQKVIFFATPEFSADINHLKGGWFLLELAKQLDDVLFYVAGPYESNIKVPDNVKMLGMVKNQDKLAEYYSMADVTLLLSKRETFSMICAESLCCGTPVVGFKAGAPELISISEYSSWVEYGDMKALYQSVKQMMSRVTNKQEISSQAIRRYDKSIMAENYIEIYKEILE